MQVMTEPNKGSKATTNQPGSCTMRDILEQMLVNHQLRSLPFCITTTKRTPRRPVLVLTGKHMLVYHHLKALSCCIVGPAVHNSCLCVATAPSRRQASLLQQLPSTPSSHPVRGSISKHNVLKPIQSLAPPHGEGEYWHKA